MFADFTSNAGSYRGELLRLLAIHTLCAALEDYNSLTEATGVICCGNQGALFKSNHTRRRIPTGASQADIKRSLRNVKAKMVTSFSYEWVESHMDCHKHWNQLSKKQQLNCYCDTLAKRAVRSTLNPDSPSFGKQVLPKERVAVFIGGVKQTSDVAKGACYALGLIDAKKFYTTPLGARDSQGRRHEDRLHDALPIFAFPLSAPLATSEVCLTPPMNTATLSFRSTCFPKGR